MLTIPLLTQVALNGLTLGLFYVLMALGFTLIFGILRVINFTHGQFLTWGAYAVFVLTASVGIPFPIALVAAAALLAGVGVLLERSLFRRVAGQEFPGLVLALGVAIIMQNLALIVFGPDPVSVQLPVAGALQLAGASLPLQRLLVVGMALLALAGFHLLVQHTDQGRALRAVAQDPEVAALQGIRRGRIYALAFGIGTLLAGLAGGLIGPLFSITPTMGEGPLVKAFIVVIIGGLGSISGAALGGLLLGLMESSVGFALGSAAADQLAFMAVILFLLLRPNGLLGTPES